MPQIAQQDYIRIAPKIGRTIQNDAAGLARIKELLQRGTIFDAIITTAFEENAEDSGEIARVNGFYEDQVVYLYNGYEGKNSDISLSHTKKQYEGLAAVQLAIDEHNGDVYGNLPDIHIGDAGHLYERAEVLEICVDDHYLIATESDYHLATISLGEQIPEGIDFINISWEDAQKLIGLLIQ